MLLDAVAAKVLFAIVLSSTIGVERLQRQMPLHVTEQNGLWLVTGSPYPDDWGINLRTRFNMCNIFFDKTSAEVKGIECHSNLIPTAEDKAIWSKILTPEQYAKQAEALSRPVTHFEPNGIHTLWSALYGGLLPTQAAATKYAAVPMNSKPAWASVTPSDLVATDHDGVWHIAGRHLGTDDLVTISKCSGKLLSGDL